MIIRICTENKNRAEVSVLIDRYFDCYSIFQGLGAWNGVYEQSLLIEVAIDASEDEETAKRAAVELAQEIKTLNAQEAVLVEYIPSANIMI